MAQGRVYEDVKFVRRYSIIGIIVVCLLSIPLHFSFEWSGGNPIDGRFTFRVEYYRCRFSFHCGPLSPTDCYASLPHFKTASYLCYSLFRLYCTFHGAFHLLHFR